MAKIAICLKLFCVIWITGIAAVPQKYYMDQRCDKTLTIDSTMPSIRLDLTRYSKYSNNMNCILTVKASNISAKYPTRLLLVFREIDIKGSDFFGCKEDVLYVQDGNSPSAPYVKGLKNGLCGEREPRGGFMSSGDSLTFRFKSDWSSRDDGFKLLITPFHTGSCSGSEYRCTGGQCISGSNKCDNYRQCGESLDECEVTRTMSWIAGVVVGVVIIIVVIGVGVFCLKRFLRNRHSSGGPVKYTAAPQPTSPPVYQQPGVAPPYQSGPTPGYYPTGPDTTGYQQPAGGFYPPPPENKGYPPQDNAYPPPSYPPPQQGYAPTTNPYPYGAPTAPQ